MCIRDSGTYDFNGVPCNTAYDLLLEDILEYAPEKAQEICDIPAETIVELAHLALDGPCTHRLGWGSNSYTNGCLLYTSLGLGKRERDR